MKLTWTKGLEADAAAEVKVHYNSGARLRKRLTEILASKIDANERECMNTDSYESANWAFKQADAIGYKRALSEVISILE